MKKISLFNFGSFNLRKPKLYGLLFAFTSIAYPSSAQINNPNFEDNVPFYTAAYGWFEFLEYTNSSSPKTAPTGYNFPFVGWTIMKGQVDLHHKVHKSMGVPQGGIDHHIDVNNEGVLKQSIILSPNTQYSLSFFTSVHSLVSPGNTASAQLQIFDKFNTPVSAPLTVNKSFANIYKWDSHTLNFTTTLGTDYYIEIKALASSISYGGVLFDNLNLTLVTSVNEAATNNNIVLQNSPNPFSTTTAINYQLPLNTKTASIHIFDIAGRVIQSIPLQNLNSGTVHFNTNEFNNGMYLYSLVVNDKIVMTNKMLVHK